MLIDSSILIACTALYLAIMFFIAYQGDKQSSSYLSKYQSLIYTLSLTVYCSSWTFYGAVGNAANNGWDYFSIYLGPIIVFLFFFPFIKKLITVSKRHKITTIADFIATRYGKSNRLAAVVTFIALLGSMPYIALQLKAISGAYDTLTGTLEDASAPVFTGTAFVLTLILASFSILFGARTIDASEHHRGMLHAISFESLVKLMSFLAIALFSFNIITLVIDQKTESIGLYHQLMLPFTGYVLSTAVVTKVLLSAAAIICLPRQFHVLAVEARGGEHHSRWGVPVYLLLFSLAVVPITAAGNLIIQEIDQADLYVLLLPMIEGQRLLAIISYLGGFAAATGMVIIANIALSTMVSNDLVFPLLLRYKKNFSEKNIHSTLLFIRRAIIFLLMWMAYGYFYLGGTDTSLQSIGLISFAAAIQFLPPIVGGLYWRRGHRNGALAGLISGFLIWIYCLLLPSLSGSSWMPNEFVSLMNDQQSLLHPQSLLGFTFGDSLTHGVFWSLLTNILGYVFFSVKARTSLTDHLQASAYVDVYGEQPVSHSQANYQFLVSDLFELCERFTGSQRAQEYFLEHGYDINKISGEIANKDIQALSERLLARSIGTATAEHIINSASKPNQIVGTNLYELIDQTGQAIEFNRELLQVTLDHIGQAVSVVDRDLRLVAWNRFYIELFSYPAGFICVGKPIEEVIRYNVKRGYGPILDGNLEKRIAKRLEYLKYGDRYTFVRDWQNGLIIQTEGARLPDGGFITTYTDITPLKMAQRRLSAINETLEAKVVERTERLSEVNQQLEESINSKTHFLAAASHDLVQPLNASKLYMGALLEDLADDEQKQNLAKNSLNALTTAESLLKSLLQLSKLDSGVLKPDVRCFELNDIFNLIENEFTVIAQQKGLILKVIPSDKIIKSDRSLLLSILQNLVSNAIRYTEQGVVLIVCRRAKCGFLRVEVRDSGQGILQEKQQEIFQPFKRIGHKNKDGVGLGLAICQQAAILLGHEITLRSDLGKGSTFGLMIPEIHQSAQPKLIKEMKTYTKRWLEGMRILCVDDDHEILKASESLLERWGANITCIDSSEQLRRLLLMDEFFDVVLMDYQLGSDDNGLDLLLACERVYGTNFIAVLVTAEQDVDLKKRVNDCGFQFLSKPVEPAKLRAILQVGLSKQS